jgi:GNAT superfamily N-acetyltransferase
VRRLTEDGFGLLSVVDVAAALLTGFRCGKDHLDAFLVDAPHFHRDRLGLTTVVMHKDVPDRVVGFFTLANDALPLTTSEQGELGLHDAVSLKAYPAVKLGRLAVAADLQGRGIGEQMMDLVHGEILDSASLSAARLVILDADNEPRVVSFYRKLGYEESLWAERQAREGGPRKIGPAPTVKMIRDILA